LYSFRLVKKRHHSAHFITDSRRANWFYHVTIHARLKAFAPVIVKSVGRNRDNGQMARRA
jgi:hypothetical protein